MSTIACTNIGGMESFAECLRRRREAKGWSAAKLARLANIAATSLRRWEELPHYVPAYRYRLSLRKALGLTWTDDGGWWGPDR